MKAIGVDFVAPVMIRRAWFCTLSRVCWFALADVAQEDEIIYSKVGLTVPRRTILSICSLAHHVVPASLRIIAFSSSRTLYTIYVRSPRLPLVKCHAKVDL